MVNTQNVSHAGVLAGCVGEAVLDAREETKKGAKIRLDRFGRSRPRRPRTIIWKMPLRAGISLWKPRRWFIHNDDSRGLDCPEMASNTPSTQTPGVCAHFPVVAG
jgi:hypothetical protein